MIECRFGIGTRVRLWKPGHAEHGAYGAVISVAPYDGPTPDVRGPWMYMVYWTWSDGVGGFAASLPDCMVCSEQRYQESLHAKV